MHGSDTGTYTEDGEFSDRKFNEMFDRYDSDKDGYWTWSEYLLITYTACTRAHCMHMTCTQSQRVMYMEWSPL